MVATGDDAPTFTAAVANGDIERFDLAEHLGDGPVVLAFYPAAFSNTCTDEMCTFRDELDRFADVGGQVFGISTDLPHAQQAYRQQYDLPFPLVADPDHNAIEAYDVISDFADRGVEVVAQRSVFVVDSDGIVTYRWLAEHPGKEPDYDAVADAVADAV
ncbi:redoxin domain-containing protein [Haloparvum sp. PAK95]|uniref:redoxin domain-containing protein n=1 Tax=Haloparvum sp. PAK95 TaxID=3418962 RepID=UPI003D2F45EF